MTGMTVVKIAVSLPEKLVARVRREVERGKAASVSAYVAAALEEHTNRGDLQAMIDEMLEETGGPLTEAEKREAEELLGLRPSRAKRRR